VLDQLQAAVETDMTLQVTGEMVQIVFLEHFVVLMAAVVAAKAQVHAMPVPLLNGEAAVVADTMVAALWALVVFHFLAAKVAPLKLWV
jgi:hypothetical protein